MELAISRARAARCSVARQPLFQ